MAHFHASHWFCERASTVLEVQQMMSPLRADPSATACDQTFSTRAARRSHSNRSQRHIHDFCGWCDRFLEAGEDMNDHDEDYHYPCRACDEVCESLEDCNEHGRLYHFWCDTHERAFRSQSNYDQVRRAISVEGKMARANAISVTSTCAPLRTSASVTAAPRVTADGRSGIALRCCSTSRAGPARPE